ncbi:MAG: hypothetical protein KF782_26070 [Labilithrix sp.]|nr:hypothetical protein [Labilithrix sp.]
MQRLHGALALLAFLSACGTSKSEAGVDEANDTPFGDGDGGGFGPGADGGAGSECAEDTKDIFVISEENTLYSFHPPTLVFTPIGQVRCPTGGATPTSMAVDRMGVAWVRHTDGSIWKVDTRTVACTETAFLPFSETDPFYQFGMGFSTSSKGGSNEQLFLSDNKGTGLAKLDTDTFKLSYIGPYTGDLAGKKSELTGTGDGKLYGFFVAAPAQIAEISKGTGEVIKANELPGVYTGSAWAFSFYGGDFYVYTASEGNSGGPPRAGGGSDVTRFRPSDGSVEIVKPKVGFKIVGAGVSTCAPTEGPR